jgi:hypothetical protein
MSLLFHSLILHPIFPPVNSVPVALSNEKIRPAWGQHHLRNAYPVRNHWKQISSSRLLRPTTNAHLRELHRVHTALEIV